MRIQFTHDNKTYTLETIASFAKYLAQRFAITKKPGQTEFVADFALTSYDDDCEITIPKVLSDIRETGWYGVKELGGESGSTAAIGNSPSITTAEAI